MTDQKRTERLRGYERRMRKQYGEWCMGNGQCPICEGAGPSFYPHPMYLTPDTIGHDLDCPAPVKTIMKGSYQPGQLSPIQKLRLQRFTMQNDKMRRDFDEAVFTALAGMPLS